MARNTLRLRNYARNNRKHQTYDEVRLWSALRRNQLGFRFRRQEPIGPYIIDFVCKNRNLIVEADGITHYRADNSAHERRDADLARWGFQVLHFNSSFIKDDLDGVLRLIKRHLDGSAPGIHYYR